MPRGSPATPQPLPSTEDVEQGTLPARSESEPVGTVQGSVAQWDLISDMGLQGVFGAVESHTQPEQTHPPEEMGREGSPTPRGGEWALVTPYLELLGIN